MKNLFLSLSFIFILSFSVNAQMIRVNGVESFLANDSNTFDSSLSAEDIRKIKLKKYLTEAFEPATIDNDSKKEFFFKI